MNKLRTSMQASPGMEKEKVRHLALSLTLLLFLGLCAFTVYGMAKIKKVEYEGNGKVNVEFQTDVKYKNLKVTVTDERGTSLKSTILTKDEDELTFQVTTSSLTEGATYFFTLDGIAARGESHYSALTGNFTVPASENGITIEEIDYDEEDQEVCFEFQQKVQYKKPTVSITLKNKEYVKKITDKDSNELEVRLKKSLKKGKTYQYKITGIRRKGTTPYVTLRGSFVAG